MLAAIIFIENAVVEKGTLYIIPFFNNSGSRNTRPGDGYPLYFDVRDGLGPAVAFRLGNRDASPLDQWPDPGRLHPLPGPPAPVLHRCPQCQPDLARPAGGPLMERVTFGAMEIMRREKVDVAVDIHGAETMFPVTNCIVAPEKSVKIATLAALTVKATEGFENHVEPSPAGFRGLSHREIGDYSGPAVPPRSPHPLPRPADGAEDDQASPRRQGPVPSQPGRRRRSSSSPMTSRGWPLEKRVGQHCSVDPRDPPAVLQEKRRTRPSSSAASPATPTWSRTGSVITSPIPPKADARQRRHELTARRDHPEVRAGVQDAEPSVPHGPALAAVLFSPAGPRSASRGRAMPASADFDPPTRQLHGHHGRQGRLDRRLGHDAPTRPTAASAISPGATSRPPTTSRAKRE